MQMTERNICITQTGSEGRSQATIGSVQQRAERRLSATFIDGPHSANVGNGRPRFLLNGKNRLGVGIFPADRRHVVEPLSTIRRPAAREAHWFVFISGLSWLGWPLAEAARRKSVVGHRQCAPISGHSAMLLSAGRELCRSIKRRKWAARKTTALNDCCLHPYLPHRLNPPCHRPSLQLDASQIHHSLRHKMETSTHSSLPSRLKIYYLPFSLEWANMNLALLLPLRTAAVAPSRNNRDSPCMKFQR